MLKLHFVSNPPLPIEKDTKILDGIVVIPYTTNHNDKSLHAYFVSCNLLQEKAKRVERSFEWENIFQPFFYLIKETNF